MIIVDWIIIGIIVLSCIISLFRGFIKEALSLLVWVAAFLVSMRFREPLADLLINQIDTPSVRYMAASALLFFGTLLVGGLVNFLLSNLVKATGLTGTNRLLGVIFGFIRGALIVVAGLVYLPKFTHIDEDPWWQQSVLIPYFLKFEDSFNALVGSTVELYQQQSAPAELPEQ